MSQGSTQSQNHPQKGRSIRVSPIANRDDITRIKHLLQDKPRDACLFTLGINTAYRAGELLSLTVGQVAYLKPTDQLTIMQSKTHKPRTTTINAMVYQSLQRWLTYHPKPDHEAPLFISQQSRQALIVSTVNHMVKRWCAEIGLQENYGSHTLRKTWGYHQLRQNKTMGYLLPVLMTAYGHATQQQTLDYLCIQADEVQSLYLGLEL